MFSLVTASFGLFSKLMDKILGAQLITDLSGFVGALDSMFGGFRERSEQTFRVLQAPETAFLVVAAPEPDAIREADYFAGRLAAERDAAGRAAAQPGARAGDDLGQPRRRRPGPATSCARAIRSRPTCCWSTPRMMARYERERANMRRFTDAHPEVPVAAIVAQPVDIHDIDGLREIGAGLATARARRVAAESARPERSLAPDPGRTPSA